jgi:hypothetical protein
LIEIVSSSTLTCPRVSLFAGSLICSANSSANVSETDLIAADRLEILLIIVVTSVNVEKLDSVIYLQSLLKILRLIFLPIFVKKFIVDADGKSDNCVGISILFNSAMSPLKLVEIKFKSSA